MSKCEKTTKNEKNVEKLRNLPINKWNDEQGEEGISKYEKKV